MFENQSIVKKTESAIDDLIDLWRRRKGACIVVIIILIIILAIPSSLSIHSLFSKIQALESKIEKKNEKISDLEKKLENAIDARDKAEIRLAPFLAAAERRFPEALPEERLNLLMDKLDEVATLEKQKKMLAILQRMQRFETTDHDVLSSKYNKGYFLFATHEYTVIPSNTKVKSNFTLDWENSRIKSIDDSIVYVFLKGFYYHPTEISVENLSVLLERKIGAIADGIYFNKVGLYIELLDDTDDKIIYVVGFREVESLPKARTLKPNILDFQKRYGLPPIAPPIDTNVQKYIKILNLTITSGWED